MLANAALTALFLLWVNFLPPLAYLIFREHFNHPLDHNLLWFDRRPVFGPHKTIRGLLACLAGGIAFAPLLGISWLQAGLAALLASAGDLLSSFLKRRLNRKSGQSVFLLDHIFEGLFPALLITGYLNLSWLHIPVSLAIFLPVAWVGSAFWRFLTSRPGLENYPLLIRSTRRYKRWRACHLPLSRWQTMFNLSSFLSHQIFLTGFFKAVGLHQQGIRNTLDPQVENITFTHSELPGAFEGFRILFMTDLHLDGHPDLTDALIEKCRNIEADLCLIGGDIRMKNYGPIAPCLRRLKRLVPHLRTTHGVLGVIGNHDCLEMAPDFEEAGIIMLINDSWNIEVGGETIWLAGLDDPHYYRTDNAGQAFGNVPEDRFSILLAHSPEAYKEAAACRPDLYLCGHTHGGQIRLPGRGPILTNSRAPRYTANGWWQYREMTGYTSRGTGASGVPLRFNCPGEITLITLTREKSDHEPAHRN
ncbi:MAG: metallophosphoesterase [Desulfurivibrionaceae bacterium]